MAQIVDDPADIGSGYAVEGACVGDAALVLEQLRSALAAAGATPRGGAAAELAPVRDGFPRALAAAAAVG